MADEPDPRPTVALVLRRLDHQDELLTDIRAQARLTNGRVTALERKQIERDTRDAVLAETAAAHDQRLHWRIGTLIALVSVTAAVSATVAQLI